MGPSPEAISIPFGWLDLLLQGGAFMVAVISLVAVMRYRRQALDRSISKEDEARLRAIERKQEELNSAISTVPGMRELHELELSTERMNGKMARFDQRLEGVEDKLESLVEKTERIHNWLLERENK